MITVDWRDRASISDALAKHKREISALEVEIEDLYTMSEEAACDLYNVDDKGEALTLREEELQPLYEEYEELESALEHFGTRHCYDIAFRTPAQAFS